MSLTSSPMYIPLIIFSNLQGNTDQIIFSNLQGNTDQNNEVPTVNEHTTFLGRRDAVSKNKL
jgi:hypothetical protein